MKKIELISFILTIILMYNFIVFSLNSSSIIHLIFSMIFLHLIILLIEKEYHYEIE